MRYSSIKFYCFAQVLLLSLSIKLIGQIETLTFDKKTMNVVLRQTAMPELGDSRLEKILTRYYFEGLGGPEHWDEVESLRVLGTLKTSGKELQIAAYQKKPTFIKMTLRDGQNTVVLGYDGEVAWHILLADRSEAKVMDAEKAREFIHSAHFGNYLLYPFAKGKTISYIDTVPIEGGICHQIRVVLESEFQVDYFIDIRSYLETKVENTDLRDQSVTSIVYTDYIREFGMPIAKTSSTYEDGRKISELTIDEVKVNSGVMPWMFKMPR
ncbi:MAG TPA: hypothetical protein DCX06_11520 [Opitutae bacterium]|nr:hypothetical protein [Opitutae bacterium]